jgi:hypothetical protein
MSSENTIQARTSARDAALRKLNRLTAGVAFSALAGVGGLAVVSAETIPGSSTPSSSAAASASSSTSESAGAPPISTTPATSGQPATFQPSSGVSSGSGPAHVVTGAS